MDIEIPPGSDFPAFRRGRELAREFLLSSSKPEDLTTLCKEMVDEVLEKEEASILASVVYHLAMVAVGLRRALELEEDPQFADGIVDGLWEALAESPFPPELAQLKLAGANGHPAEVGGSATPEAGSLMAATGSSAAAPLTYARPPAVTEAEPPVGSQGPPAEPPAVRPAEPPAGSLADPPASSEPEPPDRPRPENG